MPEIIIRQIAFGADGGPAILANGTELPIDNETLDKTVMCMRVRYPYIAHSYTFRLSELNGQITGTHEVGKLNSFARCSADCLNTSASSCHQHHRCRMVSDRVANVVK